MTPVHVFYEKAAGELYRRVAGALPLNLPETCFDENCLCETGWLVFCVPNTSSLTTSIPYERRAICINEPSAMNCLPLSFLNQFRLLISPYRVPGFDGDWYKTHTGLPWFFGAKLEGGGLSPTMSLQQLMNLEPPEKSNTVSVVLSRKVFHDGHRRRLRLLEMLKDQLGDRLIIYGRGIREIDDKAQAILPSALHLSLENTSEESYWTEKLSDAFLGYALPVYGGCPNIHDWFSPDSLLTIDPDDAEATCSTLRTALDTGLYYQRLDAIREARNRVLHSETIFHVISRAIAAFPASATNRSTSAIINPPGKGGFADRLRRESRRIFHQITFRSRLAK